MGRIRTVVVNKAERVLKAHDKLFIANLERFRCDQGPVGGESITQLSPSTVLRCAAKSSWEPVCLHLAQQIIQARL